MKKMILAAAAAVLVCACAKTEVAPKKQEVKVKFEIAEKGDFGADTKAVKTGWELGDVIRVVLSTDPYGNDFATENYVTFLRWENNSGKPIWRCNTEKLGSTQDYNGHGVYKAVFHIGFTNWGVADGFGVTLPYYKGGEYLYAEGEYTIMNDELVLGTINMIRPEELIQISVEDLGAEDGTWTLSVEGVKIGGASLSGLNHLAPGSLVLDSQINFTVDKFSNVNAQGVKVGDDVAFCFLTANDPGTANCTFTLSNGTQTYTYTTPASIKKGKAYLLPSLESNKWGTSL